MTTTLLIIGACVVFSAGFGAGALWCGLALLNRRGDEVASPAEEPGQ